MWKNVPETCIHVSVLDQSVHEYHAGFLSIFQYAMNQKGSLNTNTID